MYLRGARSESFSRKYVFSSGLLLATVLVLVVYGSQALAKRQSRVVGEYQVKSTSRFVTSREVQIKDFLERFLELDIVKSVAPAPQKKLVKELHFLQLDSKDFPQAVTRTLLENAIFEEAKNFDATKALGDETEARFKQIAEALKASPEYLSFEVSPSELRDFLSRKRLVREFMKIKSDSSRIPISDTEVELYYKQNKSKFGNLPFSEFKERIRTYLRTQQTEERLKNWFEILTQKYKVRNFVSV